MDYIYLNKNPYNKHVNDCVYRALAYFFNTTWKAAVKAMVYHAIKDGNVNFNYTTNIVDYIEDRGYKRYKAPRKGMTVKEFGEQTKPGEVYLVYVSKPQHLTIIDGGVLFDTWDCSYCAMDYYFKKEKEVQK